MHIILTILILLAGVLSHRFLHNIVIAPCRVVAEGEAWRRPKADVAIHYRSRKMMDCHVSRLVHTRQDKGISSNNAVEMAYLIHCHCEEERRSNPRA